MKDRGPTLNFISDGVYAVSMALLCAVIICLAMTPIFLMLKWLSS